MFLNLLKSIFKWIICYFDFVDLPSDDLEEKARFEIESKLKDIRKRKNVSEVDARTCNIIVEQDKLNGYLYSQRYGLFDIPIPDCFDEFVEFNCWEKNVLIREASHLIFRGKFLDQKKIVIKKNLGNDHVQLDKEMKMAEKLRNHENILTYLFGFKHSKYEGVFVAMENFDAFLIDYSKVDNYINFDIKDILRQVSTGLRFMHEYRIAHCCLNLSSIAIVKRGKTVIYKISNFLFTMENACERLLKADVEVLAYMIDDLVDKLVDIVGLSSTSDEVLRVDLIEKMSRQNFRRRLTFEEVLTHPFLWTSRETLHFVVKLAKLLESKHKRTLYKILENVTYKVFTSDWRGYIDKQVLDDLKSVNFHTLPLRNIIGLIKTIRNLVSYF